MGFDDEDEILGKAYDAVLMRRLLGYVRPYLRLVAVGAGALLLFSFLDLAPAELIKRAVDGPLANSGELGRDRAVSQLLGYAGIFGAVVLVSWVIRCTHMMVVEYLGQRVMVDLRQQLFTKIQGLSLRFYDRNPVGRLVTRVVSDVEALYAALSSGIVAIFGDVVKIAAIVGVLLWLNASLALWIFTVIPLMFGVSLWFRNRARQGYRDVRKQVARTSANVQESVTGIRVIQVFGQEEKAKRRFGELAEDLFGAHRKTIFHFAWFFPAVDFLFSVSQALLIVVGGEHVAQVRLSPGEFFQFWLYISLVFEPIRDLSEQYNVMQSAMASSERIFRILDTPDDVPDPPVPVTIPEGGLRGEVEFDHVSFAYRGDSQVIRDLSFVAKPGESIALVGHTGAGKTTIISLLSRLYDVQHGHIRIDGRDLRDYDKHELRRNIAVVLQDVFLFAGDIRENIRLGHAEITAEQVEAAARAVSADRFIERLPGGYDAPVLERGATLSVGQKQLLAFARALAFDPRILVLDEATSSVDTETELLIQEALTQLLEGRTSIIIAHRLSTIQRCDRILVMHHGELREQGTHLELLKKRGIYRRLYELQYRGQSRR